MNKNLWITIGALIALVAVAAWVFPKKEGALVKDNSTITLKNGDIYDLRVSKVTQNINGKQVSMLAYNGSIPGPTLRVEQGSEITIKFKNDTDDVQLLHSHGVRMDNQFDGSQVVQKDVKPGETFSYRLKFPDVGIYWYHPHVGEIVGQGTGLYGAFVVVPKDKNYFPPVNEEQVLFLSDLPIKDGKIELDDTSNALMGHYGNQMLVNGSTTYTLQAKSGEVLRLYLVNSANVRPFNFAIQGAKMKLVGGDNGAYEKASYVDNVILSPSERAIIDVYFPHSGVYSLENKTPEKIYTLGTILAQDSAEISYLTEFNILQTNEETKSSVAPFQKYLNQQPDKRIKLTVDTGGNMMGMNHGSMMSSKNDNDIVNLMGMKLTKEQAVEHCKSMPNMTGCADILNGKSPQVDSALSGIEWEDTMGMMNQMMTTDNTKWKIVDEDTKKENIDINWELTKGKPVVIEIYNDPNSMHPMQHPIHFHGQRFLVASRNGVPQTNLVWKDTVLVRAGETVKIVLDPSNSGIWMAHCHISEHLASGMMFGFTVK